VFLIKRTTKHPSAVSIKCPHHCFLMIPVEGSNIISIEPFDFQHSAHKQGGLLLDIITESQWRQHKLKGRKGVTNFD